MTMDVVSAELKTVLRRLKLSGMLSTLADRLALSRQQKMPHQDFLLMALSDEASRRDSLGASLRAAKARLDPEMQLESWDATAKVTYDKALLNEIVSLRFIEANAHVGHIACRRGFSVVAVRADKMLKTLKHARLDNTYEAELRKLIAVDLLIVDDFGLDAMDATESRDAYEILTERHRAGSMVVTSNRGPDEWHATFADPIRAQAAIDRFTSGAYDLVIEGESYRARQKPSLKEPPKPAKRKK